MLRNTGAKLREFGLDECHGGPHEVRPVFRAGLLKALERGVPRERLHFGVKVVDVGSEADGAPPLHSWTPLPSCAVPQPVPGAC